MIYISEMDERAQRLAREHCLGLEIIEFCTADKLDDEALVLRREKELHDIAALSLHAPFAELYPSAIDPQARELAKKRLLRASEVCVSLNARRMVAHTGCAPRIYFPEWYMPKSIEFWKELLTELPSDVEILLENVLDPDPAELATIVDGVGDARLGVCLDVGHANINSPFSPHEWVAVLGSRIREIHIHDNDGAHDLHLPIGHGGIDMAELLSALRHHCPDADLCVECPDATACLDGLEHIQETTKVRNDFDLNNIIIPPVNSYAMKMAAERQSMLAKPPGSLGLLEDISVRFAGMTGRVHNRAQRRRLLVFAADNGVTVEGVSSAPPSVTRSQTINLALGKTGAATLARHFRTELKVYDVGVDAPEPLGHGVQHRRIARGTRNIANEAAMTREEARSALQVGFYAVQEAARDGMEIIGIGEMGIGNTTTSAAVLSAILDLPADACVGRGGGVSDAGFKRKLEIVETAVTRVADRRDVIEVLVQVGGLDIAAMCGAFIGAAYSRLPVVIDGYISVVAALCAERMVHGSRDYFFASHASWERGYAHAIESLGLKPMLALEMRLGEGSGCPLAFEVIDAALVVLNEMATFDEAQIDDGYLETIRVDEHLQR